jgi:hypothetical protein
MPMLDREIIASQIGFYNVNKCDIVIPVIQQSIEPLLTLHMIFLPIKADDAGMTSLFFRNCNVQQFEYLTNTIFINFISIKNLTP